MIDFVFTEEDRRLAERALSDKDPVRAVAEAVFLARAEYASSLVRVTRDALRAEARLAELVRYVRETIGPTYASPLDLKLREYEGGEHG